MSFICSLSISYYKATQLIYLFISSCYIKNYLEPKISFIFTDVREAFSATLLICLVFSLVTFSSFVIYSFVCFLLPCWFVYERASKLLVVCALFFSCILYTLWFHMFIIPKVCDFFFTFQVQNIECFSLTVEPRIYSYVTWGFSFLALALFFFALVCLFFYLVITGEIALSHWSKNRKSRVFGSLLLAALASPPELVTQLFVSLGLFVLSEFIVFFAFLFTIFVTKKSTKMVIV
jgi:sec-independent protein translocase protein TatC